MATAPQPAANPFADPQTTAVYDQMRQSVSPKEFGDEVLAGAEQVDPQAVAQFKATLDQIQLPPEALDLLNNMVDEILANPDKYAEIRAKYKEMGAPDEILPEQFDAHFFAALNMAVDQMIGAPSGEQAFAKGGIAELTPVSKAISSYGRNGDTMLAHITPAEARMLRRKGGSGTINPKTGLPEFFNLFKSIGKAFKAVGNAVKDFASSTVGRIVTTVALGFFLGPAAASFMNVTSAAGIAAVSGFVGGAGATLLGGGNLSQALKAGAIGGITAGATTGITGGAGAFESGAATTPSAALQGQMDKFSNFINPTPSGIQAPSIAPTGQTTGMAPIPEQTINPLEKQFATPAEIARVEGMNPANASDATLAKQQLWNNTAQAPAATSSLPAASAPVAPPANASAATAATGNAIAPPVSANPLDATQFEGSLAKAAPGAEPSFFDKAKTFYNENISPSGIQQQGTADALATVQKQFPTATMEDIMKAPAGSPLAKAYNAAMPGILSTYGPATALGIGAIGAFGGFSPAKPPQSALKTTLLGGPGSARDLLNKDPNRFYIQGLPGVQYYNGSVLPNPMAEGGEVRHMYTGGITDADVAKWWSDPENQKKSDAEIKAIMQQFDVSPEDFARSIGANQQTAADIAQRYETAQVPTPDVTESNGESGTIYVNTKTGETSTTAPPVTIATSTAGNTVTIPAEGNTSVTAPTGGGSTTVTAPTGRSASDQAIWDLFANHQDWSLGQFKTAIDAAKYSLEDIARVTGTPLSTVREKYALASSAPTTPLTAPVTTTVAAPTKVTTATTTTPTTGTTTPLTAPWFMRGVAPVTPGTEKVVVPSTTLRSTTLPTDSLSRNIQGDLQAAGPTVTNQTMQQWMDKQGWDPQQVAYATGAGLPEVQARYYGAKNAGILSAKAPTITTPQPYNTTSGITQLMSPTGPLGEFSTRTVTPVTSILPTAPTAPAGGIASLSAAPATPATQNLPNLPQSTVATNQLADLAARAQKDYLFAMNDKKAAFMNMGGIAGLAQGGYPRRTGQISGPGTETSDSIPAMLSDGEFVMTAKAVRGAGKGDRRAGAKRMYALMHQLEQNAARG